MCGARRPLSHRSLAAGSRSTHSVPAQITPVPVYPVAAASGAQALFDQLDTNHDGVITREEYARLHMQPCPVQLTSVPIAQSYQPAGPAMARTVVPAYPVVVAPVRQSLFDKLDRNHDGVLTRDELARLQ